MPRDTKGSGAPPIRLTGWVTRRKNHNNSGVKVTLNRARRSGNQGGGEFQSMTKTGASAQPSPVATALVISADEAIVRQLTEGLQQFAMRAEVCGDPASAMQSLNRHHFEAVVVDLQIGDQAREIFERVRLSPSSQTAATFAVTTGGPETIRAVDTGSHFVLERPLSAEAMARNLKAAYGMIMRERRRYFRCPVVLPAVLRSREGGELQCKTLNISENGMALTAPIALKPGSEVAVAFSLPDEPTRFSTESKVCWSDGTGRLGLQFLNLSQRHRSELQGWLSRKLEEILPEAVANKFQNPGQS